MSPFYRGSDDLTGKDILYKRVGLAVAAGLLALFLAGFTVINFLGFERFCTSDMYEDTYVAKLMWEQKTLFPRNWVFGNQFYVETTPVLAALFYGMTGSMNLSMALATTGMTALMLLTFWWMLRPFAGRGEILLALLLLVSGVIAPYMPLQIEGQIFYILASFYAGYAVAIFTVYGDYLRALTGRHRRFFNAPFVLSLILSFTSGMQSVRAMAVMILPMAAYEGLSWIVTLIKTKKLPEKGRMLVTFRAAVISLANAAGYLAVKLIGAERVTIYGGLTFIGSEQRKVNIETGFRALRSITGFKYLLPETPGHNVFVGVFALLLIAAVIFALVRCGRRAERREGIPVFLALCFFSLLIVLAINAVVEMSLRSIYLFIWYPMAAVSVIPLYRALRGRLRAAGCAVFAFFIAANFFISVYPSARDAALGPETRKARIARYIEDAGYDTIYGEWSTVEEIAAQTDGRVTSGSWFGGVFKILGYINPQDIYTQEHNAHAVILLTSWNRDKAMETAAARGAELTCVAEFEDGIELYISSEQLMYRE